MDNFTKSPEEKYNLILENTAREVNRVLANWYMSGMEFSYDNVNSLFRSYFAKYCKQNFDYRFYRSFCSYDKPRPIIAAHMLVGIDLSDSIHKDAGFMAALKEFNFTQGKLFPKEVYKPGQDLTKALPSKLIDYKKLEQFKY